ncbi:MAG TPA: endonuclease MutS2, partial [Ruminococcaceae bacterium]|nr:endonuclease MutS2 [Oscillospiraceae bacterium]
MDKEIKKHLTTLELDKVLKMLANETACGDAAHAALSVSPASSEDEAEHMLAETDEAFVLLAKYGSPPFGGLENIINELRRADAGAMLTMAELLKVSAVLRTLRALSEWHEKNGEGQSGLGGLFNLLMPNKYLEDRINDAVLSEEEMSDTASPRLSDIRRRARSAMARAREIPDRIIRSASYQKYLQEPIVTIRNGRFVVPVKAEYRGEVKGLVHDTSSSGSTVFIEPMGAVEAN